MPAQRADNDLFRYDNRSQQIFMKSAIYNVANTCREKVCHAVRQLNYNAE